MDEQKRLECLLQASSVLHSSLDMAELLRKMLDMVSELLECERGLIYILDPSKGDLVLKMQKEGAGRPEEKNLKVEVGATPQRFAADSGVPVLVEDLRQDPRFLRKEEGSPDSLLCVPMHFDKKLIGVIEVVNRCDNRPFDYQDLRLFQGFANICGAAVINASRVLDMAMENRELKEKIAGGPALLVGNTPAIRRIAGVIRKIASTDSIVLITGESGTGKEIIARGIHASSRRNGKPFLPVNCGALPETLLESELFGHEKGAFTGAEKARAGLFEEASGGTIFLDEIGETSLSIQVKLLRVLQEGMVKRLGSNRETRVDARIISATNQDLKGLIEARKFREDLYYRLNVVNLAVPPLRERMEDLPVLADYLLRKACGKLGKKITALSPKVMRLFFNRPWKGNVRELENVIESAAAMCEGPAIEPEDLPAGFAEGADKPGGFPSLSHLDFEAASDLFERHYFGELLASVNGDAEAAAEKAGVSGKSVLRRKSKFNL